MALAAVVAMAAIAALSGVAARAAVRESAALVDQSQAARSRALLRARLARLVANTPRVQLVAAATSLGVQDTTASVQALVWPWHRAEVNANATEVIAELALAMTPQMPACGVAVVSGAVLVAPGTVTWGASSSCPTLVDTVVPVAIDAFADSLESRLVLGAMADSVAISGIAGPGVWRAARVLEVATGAQVDGVLSAPVIHMRAGSIVRGAVVARDLLTVQPTASLVGDPAVVAASVGAYARLRLLGRRGLLRTP